MNTGRVGGKADDERSKKVKIPHSSAVVKAIAEQSIKWTDDASFGYEVAEDVPGPTEQRGSVTVELLRPRRIDRVRERRLVEPSAQRRHRTACSAARRPPTAVAEG